MASEKQVNDLVAMIDQFVISGGGHMNVVVQDEDHMDIVEKQTSNSNCNQTNSACQMPTFDAGNDIEK